MIKSLIFSFIALAFTATNYAQKTIPLDTINWDIDADGYLFETYKGQPSIYLQGGSMTLKNVTFLNGTIEYDIQLKDERGFPGIYFRLNGSNGEQFYVRPHQRGNPDANQATGLINGISPWQFYFGKKYSFPYKYNFKDWTHVKLVIKDRKAQVFLDHAKEPNNSWELFHEPKSGKIRLTGGMNHGVHIANIKIDHSEPVLDNFTPGERKPLENLIPEWEISDKFEESNLSDPVNLSSVLAKRKWGKTISVEEGVAANISREVELRNNVPGNTVFARITITSNKDQTKLFEFGYSDRVVAYLNNQPIYKGNNRFQSRDYRYLGTIGLFDAIYLNLKKGKNTLLLAVSEDFGGWLVTGRFSDSSGLKIK